MKQVGNLLPVAQVKRDTGGKPAESGRRPGAWFAETKEAWAIQVAADRDLPETALRIALVLPKWLNSKSLKAWPAQSTIAELINTSDRAVRSGLKRLVKGGHLVCLTDKPGGRMSNVYRIVVNDEVISEPDTAGTDTAAMQPGTGVPVRPEHGGRTQRNTQSGHPGAGQPGTTEPAFRGTLERTPDKTMTGDQAGRVCDATDEPERGPQVSPKRAQEIMAEIFGQGRVSETGYLQRKD